MSNTWVNPTIVAAEVLRQLKNNTVMGELVHRAYEKEWATTSNGWKKGQTVTIKAPVYARVQDGATLHDVDAYERSTTFTLGYRKHVPFKVSSDEMTYNAEKNVPRLAKAAAQALGEYIDLSLLGAYASIPNQVGTPGQTPKDFLTLALANALLADQGCPTSDIRCVLNPTAQAYIADALKNLYNPTMVGPLVERAKFATVANMDCFISQNVNSHTCGTAAGLTTNLVDGTASEGDNTITIDQNGTWSNTLTKGDIFTVAAVYGVNPITGQSYGKLRQFCVDANVAATGTEQAVTCTPGTAPYALYDASAADKYLPYQNVDVLPQNNAVVSVAGSASLVHPVNLAFHKDCLGLAMVPLEVPDSVVWKAQETYEGYTVRVIKDYDVQNDVEYLRFDVLFGIKVLNPFLGVRIAG